MHHVLCVIEVHCTIIHDLSSLLALMEQLLSVDIVPCQEIEGRSILERECCRNGNEGGGGGGGGGEGDERKVYNYIYFRTCQLCRTSGVATSFPKFSLLLSCTLIFETTLLLEICC